MTLLNIWQYHYACNFAAGVKLLTDHDGWKHLTKQTALRLKTLAASGDPVDKYNLGKLELALNKVPLTLELKETPDLHQLLAEVKTGRVEPKIRTITFKHFSESEDLADFITGTDQEPSNNKPAVTSAAAKELHKEHAHFHALMVSATTDAERALHAEKVLDVSVQLDHEYDRIRGKAPSDPEAETKDAPERQTEDGQLRRLQSLRSRCARIKNKLIPKASGPRLAALEKELEIKQADIRRIEDNLA